MYRWRRGKMMRLVVTVVSAVPACAAVDGPDWLRVLALPEPCAEAKNACHRWLAEIEGMPPANAFEQAVLAGPLPDEAPAEAVVLRLRAMLDRHAAMLDAFTLRENECAELPRGTQMGRGFPDHEAWMVAVRLKQWQMRVAWWRGLREVAVGAAADLICVGGRAARDATDIQTWIAWMQVFDEGCESALWLARQIDIGDEELARLSDALRDATGAWPEGAAQALRGRYGLEFRPLLERLPVTDDISIMSAAMGTFGLPELDGNGTAAGPLLDVDATGELYGSALADAIRSSTANPVWSHGRLGEASQRRNERLLAELGAFGEYAMRGAEAEFPEGNRRAVHEILARTVNPIGKLLVVMFTPNLDAIAYSGLRAETQRRCTRILVEWRRFVGRSAEPPATPAAWARAGFGPADIEDPFTGLPLRFSVEKMRVWSPGIDGVDNHGTGDPEEAADGADFWWSLEAE